MADQLSNEVAVIGTKRLLREDEEDQQDHVNDSKLQMMKTASAMDGVHPHPHPHPDPEPFDPVEVIKNGFHHFKTNEFDKYPEYFKELAKDQHPKIRYSGVGAVIEYAVTSLQVEIILVIGHSRCGGIKALMELPDDGATSNDFVHDWIKIGLPARAKVKSEFGDKSLEEQCMICEREAVNFSLVNLLTYPYVQEKVAKGTLKLMGGHYDFVIGKIELWGLDFGMKPLLSI